MATKMVAAWSAAWEHSGSPCLMNPFNFAPGLTSQQQTFHVPSSTEEIKRAIMMVYVKEQTDMHSCAVFLSEAKYQNFLSVRMLSCRN